MMDNSVGASRQPALFPDKVADMKIAPLLRKFGLLEIEQDRMSLILGQQRFCLTDNLAQLYR